MLHFNTTFHQKKTTTKYHILSHEVSLNFHTKQQPANNMSNIKGQHYTVLNIKYRTKVTVKATESQQ